MTNRFFIILTDDDSPLRKGVFSGRLRQGNKEETIKIPGEKPGETIAFVSQTSRKATNKLRVEKTVQNWLESSPDGFAAIAYHKDWLDPWNGPHLLPFVPFSHEEYDPVYRHCLLPFSKGELLFRRAWWLLGRTGGLAENLRSELLSPFIPCHFFTQSQTKTPFDSDWRDIFTESRKRLEGVKEANTLAKLISLTPYGSDDAQQDLKQLFNDLSMRLASNPISEESAVEIKRLTENFKEVFDSLFGNSHLEMKPDPVAVFRHSIDNALNYLAPALCVITLPEQTEEFLNDTADLLIEFGEDFINVRIQLFQKTKSSLDKRYCDEIEAALKSASRAYNRLRNSLKADASRVFSDTIQEEIRDLEAGLQRISGLLRQDK